MRRSWFKAENWWTCWVVELVMNLTVVAVSIVYEFCRWYFNVNASVDIADTSKHSSHRQSSSHLFFTPLFIFISRFKCAIYHLTQTLESCWKLWKLNSHIAAVDRETWRRECIRLDNSFRFQLLFHSSVGSLHILLFFQTPIKRQMHSTCNKIKNKKHTHSMLLV